MLATLHAHAQHLAGTCTTLRTQQILYCRFLYGKSTDGCKHWDCSCDSSSMSAVQACTDCDDVNRPEKLPAVRFNVLQVQEDFTFGLSLELARVRAAEKVAGFCQRQCCEDV